MPGPKGLFVELRVEGALVFSCVTSRMDEPSFQKVWEVAGERLFSLARQRLADNRPINYGEIRVSPVME